VAKTAPAPLSAALLGVPKGEATPTPDPVTEETPDVQAAMTPMPAAVRAAVVAPRVPESRTPLPRRPTPEVAPPPIEEPRTALTVRLPLSTQERLREAAHRTRREKQTIVDEALLVWLEEHGF
jgi:hypothetical protein